MVEIAFWREKETGSTVKETGKEFWPRERRTINETEKKFRLREGSTIIGIETAFWH